MADLKSQFHLPGDLMRLVFEPHSHLYAGLLGSLTLLEPGKLMIW